LKHAFPGELTLIAILAPKHVRHHRLANRPKRPLTETEATDRDWREIEHLEKGGPIAMADHFIINEENIDRLYADIDLELDNSGFYDA
jgi:dephospho-CoA kinase